MNGENIFVLLSLENSDLRYATDLEYKYQYDFNNLLSPDISNGEVDFEIIGNIYEHIHSLRSK